MKAVISWIQRSIKTAIWLVIVCSAQAGDILIIDVNNVLPEIERIEKFVQSEQAQGREKGTRVVVVPSFQRFAKEKRQEIHLLHEKQIEPAAKFIEDNRCSTGQMAPGSDLERRCLRAEQVMREARLRVYQIFTGQASPPAAQGSYEARFRAEDVMMELAEVLRGPYRFSRVFISGHHFPGDYNDSTRLISGELFTGLTSQMAAEVMNSAPSLRDVRSLMMMGCWTGRPEVFTKGWNYVLPQAKFRSGFVETAPLKTSQVNLQIIDSLLRTEELIGNSKNRSELQSNLGKLNMNGRHMAVRVGNLYATKSQIKEVD